MPVHSIKTETPVLRMGIIGLGRASTAMIPSMAKLPFVKLTAAADLRPEALEKFASQFHAETFSDIEDLCKNPNVDAVYIATPHQYHVEHVRIAAAYKKHIIVEKPMALTLEDCDLIIKAVESAGVKLVVGHTHSFDPNVMKIREIVGSKQLGKLGMINTWNYTDFLYRPRRREELDTALGGGIIFNQVPHQMDTIRFIGGGMVRSVRAMTGRWDPLRPTEGSLVCYLEFENGVAATAVYSGYDFFDSDELHFMIGENGNKKSGGSYGKARRSLQSIGSMEEESNLKAATGYGGSLERKDEGLLDERFHPHFGIMIVSCEKGEIRPSALGLYIYDENGKREIPLQLGHSFPDREKVLEELYRAVVYEEAIIHDGRWGKATLEVSLAILESARQRKEIYLSHQVHVQDSFKLDM